MGSTPDPPSETDFGKHALSVAIQLRNDTAGVASMRKAGLRSPSMNGGHAVDTEEREGRKHPDILLVGAFAGLGIGALAAWAADASTTEWGAFRD